MPETDKFKFNEDDFDYELDTEIDKKNLDKELEKQHSLFMKYSRLAKQAKKYFNHRWEVVKRVRSKIIKELKEEAEAEKQKMPTAQIIEAEYRTDQRHIKAKSEMIDAEYMSDLLDGAVMSLHQRKAALSDLIRLYLAEYWDDSTSGIVDGDTQRAYDKKQKEKSKQIVKKRSTRRRKKP